jgi:F-type H+-transporting ATPase subunit gamma
MQTLEELRSRIDNAADMQSVVSAMKVLAVVGIRQFERALVSLNEFDRVIEMGLKVTLGAIPHDTIATEPKPGKRLLAVIFGSEQGLSGQFNEQIVAFALGRMDEIDGGAGHRVVVAMGEHVTYRLHGAGQRFEKTIPMPGSIKSMKAAAQGLLPELDRLKQEQHLDQVLLFYHKPITGATYRPFMLRLFPVSTSWLRRVRQLEWPTKVLPAFSMAWPDLFASLIRQHFIVSLERSCVRSLLAENASRLFSMQVAEKNIEEYREDLSHQLNNLRQGAITAEILDIVASSQALSGGVLGYEYEKPAEDEYRFYRYGPA